MDHWMHQNCVIISSTQWNLFTQFKMLLMLLLSSLYLNITTVLMFSSHQVILKFVKFFIFLRKKNIQLIMLNWPTAITADGCSTNMSAGNKLVENLGLTTPFIRYDYSNLEKALFTLLYRFLHRSYCILYFIRCGSHAADGSLKHLANSKIMNVSEVSDEFLPSFRKIMKHFKLGGMSKIYLIKFILSSTLHVFFQKCTLKELQGLQNEKSSSLKSI